MMMRMMIMMIRCRQPLLNPLTLSCLRPPAQPSLYCHKFFTYLFPPTLVSISFSGLHAFYYLHLSSFSPTGRRFVDICCILFITFILHISFYSQQSVVLIFRDFWSFNLFTCQLYLFSEGSRASGAYKLVSKTNLPSLLI